MRGVYRIADAVFCIDSLYEGVHKLCADYQSCEEPSFTITIDEAAIEYERQKSAKENELEGLPVQEYPPAYLETLAVYRRLAARLLGDNVLLFHGAVIEVDGKAYLFTARSGTGKTTHIRLWLKNIPGAFVVNGDKPLLRVTEQGTTVYGTPWQGKEGYGCNTSAPLAAICILTRDTKNHIERISAKEALPMLIQQANRPKDAEGMIKTLELIGNLGNTPLFLLGCNMDDEAAFVAYEGMKNARPTEA